MSRFTDRMWAEIAPLYGRILDLPFNRSLADGTLPRDAFEFYLLQDAHYLALFSRALATVAAKAPAAEAQARLGKAAHDAIVVERALHDEYFAAFGIDAGAFAATSPSPTCRAYGDFLVAGAFMRGYAPGVAAVLPCFQIYYEVGRHLLEIARKPNPYQKWIDTYADEAFGDQVREILALTDTAHELASPRERMEMAEVYVTASRYEWMFWDHAWRREAWPA